jgi:flavin reductase (DIM6/NTAB) family NADH-FMN oxidoreductase RutF
VTRFDAHPQGDRRDPRFSPQGLPVAQFPTAAPRPVPLAGDFVEAMASVCSPVAVVTAFDAARPHGTTVSAFLSLSMSPPMTLVSLDTNSQLLPLLAVERPFCINVLAQTQSDLARQFARKGTDKFDAVSWWPENGVPRIQGVCAWADCVVINAIAAGDHVVILGTVVAAGSTDRGPLTYHRRRFGTHVEAVQ